MVPDKLGGRTDEMFYEKELGHALIVARDNNVQRTLPARIVACLDANSVRRARDGKVIAADIVVQFVLKEKHATLVNMAEVYGDLLVLDHMQTFFASLAINARPRWHVRDRQTATAFSFSVNPACADILFPMANENAAGLDKSG